MYHGKCPLWIGTVAKKFCQTNTTADESVLETEYRAFLSALNIKIRSIKRVHAPSNANPRSAGIPAGNVK